MKNAYFITFRSVTFAQRGERLLQGEGVRCTLQRTPKWMEEQGCGYALRLWTDNIEGEAALLRREKLPLRRIYRQHPGGNLEELSI